MILRLMKMRIVSVLLFISTIGTLQAQDTILGEKNNYYVGNIGDTAFGLIKLARKSGSFRFVKHDSQKSVKIHHSEAQSFCKEGQSFVKQECKGRTKYLQDLGKWVYQYHFKKERFYHYLVSDDIYWPNNNHPEMKYKYKVLFSDTTLYVNRFNYHSVLNNSFGLSDELTQNCHFYEFEIDIFDFLLN